MKFTHTLALIAATMAALPTTGAVKLNQYDETQPLKPTETTQSYMADSELAMKLVGLIFEGVDENHDDILTREELERVFVGINHVYDAADLLDGNDDDTVHRGALEQVLRIEACVVKCQQTGGECCD